MESETLQEEDKMEYHLNTESPAVKTCDFYKVNKNLPNRFNHPDCFRGYSTKMSHPLYQTTNQVYGSGKPTVHEMPTTFHVTSRKFSETLMNTGMFRNNSFNISLEKNQFIGRNPIPNLQDRVGFFHFYHAGEKSRAELNK